MAALYRLDVIVRGNSTVSQDYAVKWTKNWVNQRQSQDDSKEFYADLYDSRTNRAWKVFSDIATKNRAIDNEYITKNGETLKGVIFITPFLTGIAKEVVIDTPNGTKYIHYPNDGAKIFLQVEDSLKAIARVENQDTRGFEIVLYDGTYFEEDRVRLDCSNSPIRVNVLIIGGQDGIRFKRG